MGQSSKARMRTRGSCPTTSPRLLAFPGVACVLTGDDVATRKFGPFIKDECVLAKRRCASSAKPSVLSPPKTNRRRGVPRS